MVEKLLTTTMRLNRDREEQYNLVRDKLCFYLDLQDKSASRNLSKRIELLGLQEEVFLTERVRYVVRDSPLSAQQRQSRQWVPRDSPRSRADAMLQRVQPDINHKTPFCAHNYKTLTVAEAIIILDDIYEKFFKPPVKPKLKLFKKHFIKIEFLDKAYRPLYKEFDFWPKIPLDPDPVCFKEPKDSTSESEKLPEIYQNNSKNRKMTRKSRPRIKEREDKGGYCEICNTAYSDAVLHRRSPHHLAFVKDHNNFLALDSLINAGADVATFLDKASSINGERRSLRKICNGDSDLNKTKRSKRSQSPDSTVNGDDSPKRNGLAEDDRKHNTRCSKRISDSQVSEDRQYYKVVGVSTKLRSSGGFISKKKDISPTRNGTEPLVVKFRKIRKSELSVLSDEAEQFMFPKRASSTSSTSSGEEGERERETRRASPALERRRQARPLALKEESSEEDTWEDPRRRRRRLPPAVRRTRRLLSKPLPPDPPASLEPAKDERLPTPQPEEVSPLREPVERCMKWENGRLIYTPAVEQLEFAFESVPHSEPWFETFKRQDEDKNVTKNLPQYFSLYSTKTPKLPYEIGQLPPLKPNCCPLSDLIKREEKPGPSRSYGTRGMKKQKYKKRQTAVQALVAAEGHPRKSPREHASTLAILGSAGLLQRRRLDDAKSTGDDDTGSDTLSSARAEPPPSETQAVSERLQLFLSEVFEDAAEYDVSEEVMHADPIATSGGGGGGGGVPDLLGLLSDVDTCDMIRDELRAARACAAAGRGRRRGKLKNRTGWPAKRRPRKDDCALEDKASLDRSSAEPLSASDLDTLTEDEKDDVPPLRRSVEDTAADEDAREDSNSMDVEATLVGDELGRDESMDRPASELEVTTARSENDDINNGNEEDTKQTSRSSLSDTEEEKSRPKKKRGSALGSWLQPVVRVARVDGGGARCLRSAVRPRASLAVRAPRPR